jgi:hypothetical protein
MRHILHFETSLTTYLYDSETIQQSFYTVLNINYASKLWVQKHYLQLKWSLNTNEANFKPAPSFNKIDLLIDFSAIF